MRPVTTLLLPGGPSPCQPHYRAAFGYYAASDVLHLHGLRERLDAMLAREGRTELAKACFEFLPARAKLDLGGWEGEDIFAHS